LRCRAHDQGKNNLELNHDGHIALRLVAHTTGMETIPGGRLPGCAAAFASPPRFRRTATVVHGAALAGGRGLLPCGTRDRQVRLHDQKRCKQQRNHHLFETTRIHGHQSCEPLL